MTLAAQIIADLDSVFFNVNEFARTITYNGASIPAIVDYKEDLTQGDRSSGADCRIIIRASDVADPTYRDAVVIGADTWYVLNIATGFMSASVAGHTWELNLYRDERVHL